jgi:hypothetical protein
MKKSQKGAIARYLKAPMGHLGTVTMKGYTKKMNRRLREEYAAIQRDKERKKLIRIPFELYYVGGIIVLAIVLNWIL